MNLDFKDVNTTLKDGGAAIISTGYGEGEHRVTKAINDALHSPLLKNRDIFGSKRLLFNLYFSRNADPEFAMGEANELTSFINNLDPEVDVIYGICFDDSLGNKSKSPSSPPDSNWSSKARNAPPLPAEPSARSPRNPLSSAVATRNRSPRGPRNLPTLAAT